MATKNYTQTDWAATGHHCQNPSCGAFLGTFEWSGNVGRPRRFCSNACRQKTYRVTKSAALSGGVTKLAGSKNRVTKLAGSSSRISQ